MFRGLTAWFSSSVQDSVVDDWERYGGEVSELDTAQFLFSNDSEEDDTKRFYSSEAYIKEHLAIFHSQYVIDCVKRGDRQSVVLGKYFLPPLTVRKLMKKKNMVLEWEKNEENNEKRDHEKKTKGNNSSLTKSIRSSSSKQKSPLSPTSPRNPPTSPRNPPTSPRKPPTSPRKPPTSPIHRAPLRKSSTSQKHHSLPQKSSSQIPSSSQTPSSNQRHQSLSSSSGDRNGHSNQFESGCEYVPINQLTKIGGKIIFFDPADKDWEVFKKN